MISNPATFFISGYDEESFTYEGGSTLYHFSPHDNNLSMVMDNNIVFFANSESHALDVLKRMFEFAINCNAKYIANKKGKPGAHYEEFIESAKLESKKFSSYITAIDNNKVNVSIAPTNQCYVVGWAANDTLH